MRTITEQLGLPPGQCLTFDFAVVRSPWQEIDLNHDAGPGDIELAVITEQEAATVRSMAASVLGLGLPEADEEAALMVAAQEIAEGDPRVTRQLLDAAKDSPELRRELIQRAALIDHEEILMSNPSDQPTAAPTSSTAPVPHTHRVAMADAFLAGIPVNQYQTPFKAGQVAYDTTLSMPGTRTQYGTAVHPGAVLDKEAAEERAAAARLNAMTTSEKAAALNARGGWASEATIAAQQKRERAQALDDIARNRRR